MAAKLYHINSIENDKIAQTVRDYFNLMSHQDRNIVRKYFDNWQRQLRDFDNIYKLNFV